MLSTSSSKLKRVADLQFGSKVVSDLGSEDQLLVDRRGNRRRPEKREVVEHRSEGLIHETEGRGGCSARTFVLNLECLEGREGPWAGVTAVGETQESRKSPPSVPVQPHSSSYTQVPSSPSLARILSPDSDQSQRYTFRSSVHPCASDSSARTSRALPR